MEISIQKCIGVDVAGDIDTMESITDKPFYRPVGPPVKIYKRGRTLKVFIARKGFVVHDGSLNIEKENVLSNWNVEAKSEKGFKMSSELS